MTTIEQPIGKHVATKLLGGMNTTGILFKSIKFKLKKVKNNIKINIIYIQEVNMQENTLDYIIVNNNQCPLFNHLDENDEYLLVYSEEDNKQSLPLNNEIESLNKKSELFDYLKEIFSIIQKKKLSTKVARIQNVTANIAGNNRIHSVAKNNTDTNVVPQGSDHRQYTLLSTSQNSARNKRNIQGDNFNYGAYNRHTYFKKGEKVY